MKSGDSACIATWQAECAGSVICCVKCALTRNVVVGPDGSTAQKCHSWRPTLLAENSCDAFQRTVLALKAHHPAHIAGMGPMMGMMTPR